MASSSLAILRIRDFRVLWTATMLSFLGTWLQRVASAWLMLELTGSALWVGLMAAASTLPVLLLGLLGGAFADLFDRRRVLLGAQTVSGVVAMAMAVLWFLDLLTPGILFSLGVGMGVGTALGNPAWLAFVSDLVPPRMLADAVALNAASFSASRAIGPAIGGVMVALYGPGVPFLLNSLSYFGVVVALSLLRTTGWQGRRDAGVGTAITAGLRVAWHSPVIRRLLGLAVAFALSTAVVQAVLPNLTSDELGEGSRVYGIFLAAMGIGAVLAMAPRRRVSARLGRLLLPLAMGSFGVAGILVGLSSSVVLTTVVMTFAGVFWIWVITNVSSTIQLAVPPDIRGRIMSIWTMAFVGCVSIGSIVAGALADAIGIREAIVWLSAGTVVVGVTAVFLVVPTLEEVAGAEAPAGDTAGGGRVLDPVDPPQAQG